MFNQTPITKDYVGGGGKARKQTDTMSVRDKNPMIKNNNSNIMDMDEEG